MNLPPLAQEIKGTVTFSHYQKGDLWYKTESGFLFPVPTSDTGDGKFLNSDRAMLFMRWIKAYRKEIENAAV